MGNVLAILPAAGNSRRMGRPKQLLPLGDRPAIARCLECLGAAGITDTVVVTGAFGDAVREAARDFAVRFAENPHPATEMAGSIRAGLALAGPGTDRVLVFPGDHPLVSPATVRGLLMLFSRRPGIVMPRYLGRSGHPVLLPRAVAEEIFSEPTLRDVVRKDPDRVIRLEVEDEGVVLDMDTPEDYRRAQELWRSRMRYAPVATGAPAADAVRGGA